MLVIAALAMTVAIPVGAQTTPATTSPLHTVQGKVISITGSTSFEVQNGNQPEVTVNVDGNTKYYQMNMGKARADVNNTVTRDNQQARRNGRPLPSRANDLKRAHIPANWRDNLGWLDSFDTGSQFSDIQIGDRVIARTTNDGNNLAKQILIIKAPVIQQVKGTISAVTSNSITIGTNNIVVTVDTNTRITLKGLMQVQTGQYAVAVYNKNTMVAQTISIQTNAPTTPTPAALSSIAVTVPQASLPVGSTEQLTAMGSYSNGVTANITSQVNWGSSPDGIATISSTGIATGSSAGTTSITASESGITSPQASLTVTSP